MTLGIKSGTVALYGHETEWESEAARTIEALRSVLGDAAEDIQHVGSTSIKHIKAKPIIDVAVAARDFDSVLEREDELRSLGFFYRPGSMGDSQLLFACGSLYDGTGDMQTHFIHVVLSGSTQWLDYINFRDYMNAFPAAAKEYEALKIRLAEANPVDPGRERYLAGKRDFIALALRKAAVWSFLGKTVHIGIDRPIGYVHKKSGYTLVYPINYGFIPGIPGGDGEDLDVYLLGVSVPVDEADCRVIGVVRRKNDVEDKLVAAPDGLSCSKSEMESAIRFQEQWYDSFVITEDEKPVFDELYEERR